MFAMNLLLLGRGKTGSLVAQAAHQRHHQVQIVGSQENAAGAALTFEKLSAVEVIIDFTSPHCVVGHIEACVRAGKNMVVGTTGWYAELDRIRRLVEQNNTGFLYGPNFSIGVNLFFDAACASAAALRRGYTGQIFERHHVDKKDAPSGTALEIQKMMQESSGQAEPLEIISFREGEVIGLHELVFESANDRIYLCHDAKSRRAFAEGAVLAAEWLATRKGVYRFQDIWREL
jgi:4-hydroxy-tetrahydrodipicolinate reductase